MLNLDIFPIENAFSLNRPANRRSQLFAYIRTYVLCLYRVEIEKLLDPPDKVKNTSLHNMCTTRVFGTVASGKDWWRVRISAWSHPRGSEPTDDRIRNGDRAQAIA